MINDLDEAAINADVDRLLDEAHELADGDEHEWRVLENLVVVAQELWRREKLRSHPALPQSPSDENAGEGASDEELEEVFLREMGKAKIEGKRVDLGAHAKVARRALYDLGKKRQASADAATIAALRRVVDAAWRTQDRWRGGVDGGNAILETLWPALDEMPASLRPEPGGGK